MANMTPAPKPGLLAALDGADGALHQLNALVAYAIEPDDHETHLDTIQDLQTALAAMRTDVNAL